LDSFTNMKSSCYSTDASHQEVEVSPQVGGEGAQGEVGGDAGGRAEVGSKGEEESIRYQDHEERVGRDKISIIKLYRTHW